MKHKYHTESMLKHLAISKIYTMVKDNSIVLDVGCSTGFLGEKLKMGKNCAVVGIDNDADAVKIAGKILDKTVRVDIESGMPRLGKKFDYIIFADVLEHTRNPEEIIRRFRKFLKKNGHIIVSLPNVAHPLIRLRLLLGKWDYTEVGIMDRTHVRFFTLKTARSMLSNAGLEVVEEVAAGKLPVKKTLAAQLVFKCRLR